MESSAQLNNVDFIDTLLNAFEDRVQKIETVFTTSEEVNESSHALHNEFTYSLHEFRKERMTLNEKLRENLARSGSLRKNDYDILMDEIFVLLDKKETEAAKMFQDYIDDQKAMIHFFREEILDLKTPAQHYSKEKIEKFKVSLDSILKAQQQRKDQTIAKFQEFQNIHKKITGHFRHLLDQNVNILFKDIKNVKKHLIEEFV